MDECLGLWSIFLQEGIIDNSYTACLVSVISSYIMLGYAAA